MRKEINESGKLTFCCQKNIFLNKLTCRYFTGLCSSNITRYFLDFAFDCNIDTGSGSIFMQHDFMLLALAPPP